MTVAQGIRKQTAYKKQAGLGTAASGTGGQALRRVTFVPTADNDTHDNPEIVTHQQSTGITYGLKKAAAKYAGILSAGTFVDAFANILRKAFAATTAYAVGTDVTAAAAGPQFVTAGGNFLTAGLKVGDVGRWTGFTAAHNNGRNFLITALTATNMTGIFLDKSAVVAEASGQSVTFTVVGKKVIAPLTGHTNDYYSFEDWYSDLSKSELLVDCQFAKADVKLPATGNATLDLDIIGLSRVRDTSQALTTPTAATTTEALAAVNGAVYVNGVLTTNITSAQITIDGTLAAGQAVLGSNVSSDIQKGRIKVSGTFSALFDGTTIQDIFDAQTPVGLILVIADQIANPTCDFVTITMGRIKIQGDAPDDGEKQIVRTYPFTAGINTTGGAALAWDETIITIQDSAAA